MFGYAQYFSRMDFDVRNRIDDVSEFFQGDAIVWMKRDDLIHPHVSGNKWRKLKYNVHAAQKKDHDTLITLGGAYSNHLAATAAAASLHGMKSIGLIRGNYVDVNNPTLSFCRDQGMELFPLDIETYDLRHSEGFPTWVRDHIGSGFLIPEGGANYLGVNGCSEIVTELEEQPDLIVVPVGTGTTLAGIAMAAHGKCKVLGVQVLKGDGMVDDIQRLLLYTLGDNGFAQETIEQTVMLNRTFHFGGYARYQDGLLDTMRAFYKITGIKTDPIYTGKMVAAVQQLLLQGKLDDFSKILMVHTGGLQGIRGFEQRYQLELF